MFSIEEIEKIMDDTAEATEKQREISALLSGQLTSSDEEDVLKELEELASLAENKEEALELPQVPSHPLPGRSGHSFLDLVGSLDCS